MHEAAPTVERAKREHYKHEALAKRTAQYSLRTLPQGDFHYFAYSQETFAHFFADSRILYNKFYIRFILLKKEVRSFRIWLLLFLKSAVIMQFGLIPKLK